MINTNWLVVAFSKIRPDAGELKRLYVLPVYQGMGLGRQLIELRIEAARELGVRHLYADTARGNHGMLSLYADPNHIETAPSGTQSARQSAVLDHNNPSRNVSS